MMAFFDVPLSQLNQNTDPAAGLTVGVALFRGLEAAGLEERAYSIWSAFQRSGGCKNLEKSPCRGGSDP